MRITNNNNMDTTEKVTVLIIVLIFGLALTAPYFEAKSFNECTGGDANYMTAFFTELRVENCKITK